MSVLKIRRPNPGESLVKEAERAVEGKSFPLSVDFNNTGPVPILLPRYGLHAQKGQKVTVVFPAQKDLLACVADLAQIADSLGHARPLAEITFAEGGGKASKAPDPSNIKDAGQPSAEGGDKSGVDGGKASKSEKASP